jgi:hypothetical protein
MSSGALLSTSGSEESSLPFLAFLPLREWNWFFLLVTDAVIDACLLPLRFLVLVALLWVLILDRRFRFWWGKFIWTSQIHHSECDSSWISRSSTADSSLTKKFAVLLVLRWLIIVCFVERLASCFGDGNWQFRQLWQKLVINTIVLVPCEAVQEAVGCLYQHDKLFQATLSCHNVVNQSEINTSITITIISSW